MTGTSHTMEAFSLDAYVRGGPLAGFRARRLAHHALAGRVPSRVMPDVALLLTELVANGVQHGGAGEEAELHVRFEGRPPALLVEVANPDDDSTSIGPRAPDSGGGGGLGLHIVERVADRWGVRHEPETAVWFELDCDSDSLV
jgi:anti-sigma regulatory factor (Ser/Thr protein kinase)